MEKHELFNQAIATETFKDYAKEDLLSLGLAIGSNHVTFRELYKAYFTNKSKYENEPMIGAKIEVLFDRLEDKIKIKRASTSLEFNEVKFLIYLNLLMICFGEIYPLGSVVEIDESLLNEKFQKIVELQAETRKPIYAVITGRFVSVGNDDGEYLIEYVGRLRPFGEGTKVAPLLLNKVLIKDVIHSGFVDESEESDNMKMRLEFLDKKVLSTAFATDEQLEGLFAHL